MKMCTTSLKKWEMSTYVILSVLGFFVLTKKILKFINFVWSMFFRPPKNLTNYGSWALVTGCTDGIGKAIAFELASKGLNLVLVGRNTLKLQATSNEIWDKYGKDKIKIKSVLIDFAKIMEEEIEGKIRDGIEGLDVGILVNNVGLASNNFSCFHEIDNQGVDEMVNVNVRSVGWVTKAVIPGMIKKSKGIVVNIGSGCTVAATSFPVALYGASKAYISMLSRSFSVEYQRYGIDIQCQMPMFVATKMVPEEIPRLFSATTVQYAKASVQWMGHHDVSCVPLWTHALQVYLMSSILPDSIMKWVVFNTYLYLRNKVIAPKMS